MGRSQKTFLLVHLRTLNSFVLLGKFAPPPEGVGQVEELLPELGPPDAVDDQVGGRVDDEQEVGEVEHDDGPQAEGLQLYGEETLLVL